MSRRKAACSPGRAGHQPTAPDYYTIILQSSKSAVRDPKGRSARDGAPDAPQYLYASRMPNVSGIPANLTTLSPVRREFVQ